VASFTQAVQQGAQWWQNPGQPIISRAFCSLGEASFLYQICLLVIHTRYNEVKYRIPTERPILLIGRSKKRVRNRVLMDEVMYGWKKKVSEVSTGCFCRHGPGCPMMAKQKRKMLGAVSAQQ